MCDTSVHYIQQNFKMYQIVQCVIVNTNDKRDYLNNEMCHYHSNHPLNIMTSKEFVIKCFRLLLAWFAFPLFIELFRPFINHLN